MKTLLRLFFVSLTLAFAAALPASASAPAVSELSLENEAGTLRFALKLDQGALSYQVHHLAAGGATTPVLGDSPLGLVRTEADFTKDLAYVSASAPVVVKDNYTLVADKVGRVRTSGLERTFTFRNPTGLLLEVTARAYSDGVAFRYGLPGRTSTQTLFIEDEVTGFRLPADARVWAQPYSKVDVWAPGYEANYVNGVPAGTAAPAAEGWALPLLFNTGKLWALVSESGLGSDYFAIHLAQNAPGGLYRARLPEAPETYGVAPQAAAIRLPWTSPWRAVIVGERAGAISESTLVTTLAAPSVLKDTSWIKPGVASWSWWSDMSSPSDYTKLVSYVDMSARLGWPYTLIDLGWHQMKNGGDVKQLADYAATKGVGLLIWYNSAGKHNQVPDAGPYDVMADPILRDAEFTRIAAMGIKGIKVDFMQSDKQFVIALYHDILRDAAKHKLLVNFHGCTIPRGWERTYPHLLTMEAVRGGEQYWDKTFAEDAQMYNTIYAFTRNAIGPMDYTPTVFTPPGATNPGIQPNLTTSAHELALLVVFQSGIQHVIDSAASLAKQPAYVLDYLTGLPTAWDETRYLDGAPGQLAVVARRTGKVWYLSGINGTKDTLALDVDLSFLGKGAYRASVITDGPAQREFSHAEKSLRAADKLPVALAPRGGFAVRLTPGR
jgi:hypothetical protein